MQLAPTPRITALPAFLLPVRLVGEDPQEIRLEINLPDPGGSRSDPLQRPEIGRPPLSRLEQDILPRTPHGVEREPSRWQPDRTRRDRTPTSITGDDRYE